MGVEVGSARLDKEPGPSLCSWGTVFLRATVMVGVCVCVGEVEGDSSHSTEGRMSLELGWGPSQAPERKSRKQFPTLHRAEPDSP